MNGGESNQVMTCFLHTPKSNLLMLCRSIKLWGSGGGMEHSLRCLVCISAGRAPYTAGHY